MVNIVTGNTVILQIALAIPLDRLFDYLPPVLEDSVTLQPGMRVLAPFGSSRKIGVLVSISHSSDIAIDKLKPIFKCLDDEPLLSGADIQFLSWVSHYYHYPFGQVLSSAFPNALRHGKSAKIKRPQQYVLTNLGHDTELAALKRSPKQQALLSLLQSRKQAFLETELSGQKAELNSLLKKGLVEKRALMPLRASGCAPGLPANPEQQVAIDTLVAKLGRFSVSLLVGVTGSGKTEVYMQLIAAALANGLQILVLLPEISLTPQLEQRFRQRFQHAIVCFHSGLAEGERLHAWLALQQGEAEIMLGTRSALFTPLKYPGLIILDEEHDASFKQQEGFRFSARDIAIARAKHLNIPVLLGTATPSLESLHNAQRQRYQLLQLAKRAGNAVEPVLQLLDIRKKTLYAGLSETLLAQMHVTLNAGQQVLLFLNRRGFAPMQICHSCGWVARCKFCDANLIVHAADKRLRCHHCGAEQSLLQQCPVCKFGELQALGVGTERIEQTLHTLFTDKTVVRLDRDTTQDKGSLTLYLQQIAEGKADIILGTQMLAKGHHFPNVTLVAIIDIDSALFSIDFRASEKLAQLIVQVSGRAGRAGFPGKVLLQTRHPDHPLLQTLLSGAYPAFAEAALNERRLALLPPYSHQALFRAQADSLQTAQQLLQEIADLIKQYDQHNIQLLGPVSAPMSKRIGSYHAQLLLQSVSRKNLHHLLDQVLPLAKALKKRKKLKWSLDIDPVDLY